MALGRPNDTQNKASKPATVHLKDVSSSVCAHKAADLPDTTADFRVAKRDPWVQTRRVDMQTHGDTLPDQGPGLAPRVRGALAVQQVNIDQDLSLDRVDCRIGQEGAQP